MLVETLELIPTKRGTLPVGKVVDLPNEVIVRLAGKVRAVLVGGVAVAEIEAEFSHDPDWPKIKGAPLWPHHLTEALHFRHLRERGEIPPTYTATRECTECGPVWLEPWNPPQVAGCPWCMIRAKGLPIPRPASKKWRISRREKPSTLGMRINSPRRNVAASA